ncbi:hypothetical protein CONLIGDRAFT_635904 [Coniochaeta ligniaria NRRL 30616]|uniref:Uncharacterized protein n=1 Tax=Coniochaeta ligniaria NRRL 30616 TaxID=1408157 RepID=A0A1J7IEM8_9PEZI|nr:hypothetical protein CONLIGDRAFT_635904 [Coniochaeta ligniaria NRRL 30616]
MISATISASYNMDIAVPALSTPPVLDHTRLESHQSRISRICFANSANSSIGHRSRRAVLTCLLMPNICGPATNPVHELQGYLVDAEYLTRHLDLCRPVTIPSVFVASAASAKCVDCCTFKEVNPEGYRFDGAATAQMIVQSHATTKAGTNHPTLSQAPFLEVEHWRGCC